MKITVTSGPYVVEFKDKEPGEILQGLDFCKKELPGFSLEKSSEISGNSQNISVEKSPNGKRVASKEDLIAWIAAEESPHSKSWIATNSPFGNAKRLLTQMERSGDIVLAQTPYIKDSGNTAFMQACYLPGQDIPPPWDKSEDEEDAQMLKWLETNLGYTCHTVETNCGIPKVRASLTLNRLLAKDKVIAEKCPRLGKGRIYLASVSPE